ncbi:MAG: DNA polymerase/3'-5' exonuclease PolX [Thaumarchaeota archaeon]|nr:DNA polymerase/3'-5' exonuclease PolX [Nitrososphaerota archaeon]
MAPRSSLAPYQRNSGGGDNTRNAEVADLLEKLSLLSEAGGEDRFKVIAYRRASTSVRNLGEAIEEVWKRGDLEKIQFIGGGIAKKIDEYLRTGKLEFLEKLQRNVPEGAVELMGVSGIGPRTAYKLAKDNGIKSVAQLKEALVSGRLADVLGAVNSKRILEAVNEAKPAKRRMLLVEANELSKDIVAYFRQEDVIVESAGSLRRGKETVGDLDILSVDAKAAKVLVGYPGVDRVIESGPTRTSVFMKNGVQVDIRVVKKTQYGAAMIYFTGSKDHNIALRNIAISKGWTLNEYGLDDLNTEKTIAGETERQVYKKLGLEYIQPELREARGEIDAAREGKLPDLVEVGDLRGDLQMHSTWSDGSDELETMARAAKERGYEYVAFTDHSVSIGVANGLSEERFRKQWKVIDELNDELKPFRILKSVEAEVRSDGSLDYDATFFENFDIVGASIHQSFRQSPEKLTGRAIRALNNPAVNILFHPTNRMIGQREGNPIDLPKVIKTAKDLGKMLEIDGSPNRLDLDDVWARRAMEEGVILSIDSDAHGTGELENVDYGVTVARRAWLEKKDVLNTLSLKSLLKKLH